MIESAVAFSSGRLPRGSQVAMLGFSGAARGLALDAADAEQVEFASLELETASRLEPYLDPGTSLQNPMDLGGGFVRDPERYSRVGQIVAADPNVSIVAIQGQLPVADELVDPQWFAQVAASTEKPVLAFSRTAQNVLDVSRTFQERSGIWSIQGIPETIRATRQLIAYARRFAAPFAGRPLFTGVACGSITDLLDEYQLGRPAEELARSVPDAMRIAERIGLPVALKLHSARPIHKTELGGVVLGLKHLADVEEAALRLFTLMETRPELACDGVLVQEMISGIEMIVGARMDEQFGPVIVVGQGGIFVEAFADIVLRLLPIDRADALQMLAELRGRALLDGTRGSPRCDIDALADAVVAAGRLFLDHAPRLDDLEINPLAVLPEGQGVRAVDVRSVSAGEV